MSHCGAHSAEHHGGFSRFFTTDTVGYDFGGAPGISVYHGNLGILVSVGHYGNMFFDERGVTPVIDFTV